MKYPYFRGLEADRYNFYRVPKALIKVDLFEKMSGDAKLLYAVLLDRMNLSLKNGWQDENGNAYIICTIDEIMDSIRCARQKAVKLLDEPEHEYQLIERRRQGLGKPNLLYVKDLYAGLSESNYWKKLKKFLNDAEKTESKIAELEEYLRNVRAAQKKEEDNEIVRAIRSTKLGGRDLLALLENIQAGNVTFQTTVNNENKTSEEAEMEDVIAKDA